MKKLLCLCAFLLVVGTGLAQDTGEGAYAYASLDNRGFDAVNLGNLNTRFNVPLVNRQGRGLPFNYSIQYEGLVWQPVTSGATTTWVPDPAWGFSGLLNGTAFVGYLSNTTLSFACPRPPNYSGQVPPASRLTNYVYHDQYGASHRFNYTVTGPCPLTNQAGSTTGNGSSSDGSGYSLVSQLQIKTKTGSLITPAYSATGSDNTSLTDPNGNTINSSGGNSFTDTLGETALTITGTSPRVFTYPVTLQSGGATTASATISYKTYTVRTNFGCSGIVEYGSSSTSLVDRITLADGTYYAFAYEGTPNATDGAVTARLASITLPTWGTISYSYTAGCGAGINPDGTVGSLTRTTSDGTRTYNRGPVNSNATSTTVTDEKNNQSVYQFTIAAGLFYETHRQVYQGSTSGSLLLERFTCYNGATENCDGQVVTPPFTQIGVTTSYNGGTQDFSKTTYDSLGNVLTSGEYNGSTLLEQATYTYNGYSEPLTATVADGSGNTISSAIYAYDGATPTATSGIPQHNAVTGARGNLTALSVYTASGSSIGTSTTYYDTGVPVSTTTPNGTTNYVYDSTQTFATQANLPTPSSGVALSTSASYDAGSTMPLSVTGMNSGQTTSVTSYDALLRPLAISLPNGGSQSFFYSATIDTVRQTLNSSTTAGTEILHDGYGRVSRVAVANGQSTNPWYQTDYCYDASGLLQFQSVSYQGTGWGTAKQCSGAGVTYSYDALGRVISTQTSDGTATTQYTGRAVLTKDVNGVQRITQYDFLGNMLLVCEISSNNLAGQSPAACGSTDISGTGYVTSYNYNLAAHTTTVTQGPQTRTFVTDWAGRSISTTEPERGSTGYSYTYNGTGLQVVRTRPRANQTNASVLTHTTTQYDSLGRVVSVSYDDGLTPGKNYYYDTVPSALQWSQTPSNPLGMLVATSSGTGSTLTRSLLGYDLMGNVTSLLQCAPSICGGSSQASRPMSFAYDQGSNLTVESDPTSGAIGYTRSVAGEITSITNSTYQNTGNPPKLVSNVINTPLGPTSYTLGNGLQTVQSFDSLGRISGGWVCSGSSQTSCSNGTQIYGNTLDWSGARTFQYCDTVMNQCQNHGYDEFNRLTSVNQLNGSGPGSYTYTYDRWGNRLSQTSSSGGPSPSAAVNSTTNQISGYSYDAAGNLLSDGLSHNFTYDAEGNVLQVNAGSGGSYVYDAMNHRVSVQTPSGTNEYLFDPFGRRVSTWLTSQNVGTEGRIYYGNKQIAFRAQTGSTVFEHQNFLGTERMRTNYQGSIAATESSLAFGDGFNQAVHISGTDQDNNQYAGQDYDAESSSQHAQFRQYSSTLGRWMSPDPYDGSYDATNPQSLNRFTYALNSPLSSLDPSGLDESDNPCNDWTCIDGGDGGGGGGGGGNPGCISNCGGSDPCPSDNCGGSPPPSGGDPPQGEDPVNVGGVLTFYGNGYFFQGGGGPVGTAPNSGLNGVGPNPCSGANPANLNYQAVNPYNKGAGTAFNHIFQNHILGGPGKSVYAGGPGGTAGAVGNMFRLNALTLVQGTLVQPSVGGIAVLSYYEAPGSFGPFSWGHVGTSNGQTTQYNTLVVKNCTVPQTSYPGLPSSYQP